MLGDILGCVADEIGERDERDRREDEEESAVRVDDVLRDENGGREREGRQIESPRHCVKPTQLPSGAGKVKT